MKHDRRRTTEILLDHDAASIVRRHHDPPLDEVVREGLQNVPVLGPLVRLSEFRPRGLSTITLRIRPARDEGLVMLIGGRRVDMVSEEAAPEFPAHLRGQHRDAGRDAVRGLRYIDPEGSLRPPLPLQIVANPVPLDTRTAAATL